MAQHRLVIETDTSDENFARILARLGGAEAGPSSPDPVAGNGDFNTRPALIVSAVGDRLSAMQDRYASEGFLRTARRPQPRTRRRGTRVYGMVVRPSGKTTVLFGKGLRGARSGRGRRRQARRRQRRRQAISSYIGETEKNLRQGWDWARHGGATRLLDGANARFGKRTKSGRFPCGWLTGRRMLIGVLAVATVVGVCMVVRKRRARAADEAG